MLPIALSELFAKVHNLTEARGARSGTDARGVRSGDREAGPSLDRTLSGRVSKRELPGQRSVVGHQVGEALPRTTTAPFSSASRRATSRVWYLGLASCCL